MKLCKRGHDMDIVGVAKNGITRKGSQRYVCCACLKALNAVRNPVSNARPQSQISKWRWNKRNHGKIREILRKYRERNKERLRAKNAEYRRRMKLFGGANQYFWECQVKESV